MDNGLETFLTVSGEAGTVTLRGQWTLDNLVHLQCLVTEFEPPEAESLAILSDDDFSLDIAGAWLLNKWFKSLADNGLTLSTQLHDRGLVNYLSAFAGGEETEEAQPHIGPLEELERIGFWAVGYGARTLAVLEFIGHMGSVLGRCVVNPWRLRLSSISIHIYKTTIQAVPIVALIAFLISVVLAYQGAHQLSKFGAQIYTIDLVVISVFREMGALLTAIIVAGRSGSAYAAEIGVMKINEEVDAMRTIGISPMEVLMLPRLLALVIGLPLLVFLANMSGIVGAAVLSVSLLDISLMQYIDRMYYLLTKFHWLFWIGIIKAPFFACIIAGVGLYRGMQASDSASRVGTLTTQAVVESIFLVILVDALFSILFSALKI